jgi:hypothetical protein
MALTLNQVMDFVSLLPADLSWAVKRRMAITHFWTDADVRAAEQDARSGNTAAQDAYDSDVLTIKLAIPKP